MSTEEVKTYAFSVEKELDVDICKQGQRLDLRLTKGLMELYETNEAIHQYRWLMSYWPWIIVDDGVRSVELHAFPIRLQWICYYEFRAGCFPFFTKVPKCAHMATLYDALTLITFEELISNNCCLAKDLLPRHLAYLLLIAFQLPKAILILLLLHQRLLRDHSHPVQRILRARKTVECSLAMTGHCGMKRPVGSAFAYTMVKALRAMLLTE